MVRVVKSIHYANFLLRGWLVISKSNGGYKYGKTYQGLQITNKLTDKYGRKTVVCKRKNDYCVGLGYDERYKCWSQGYYDFSSRKKALAFAKKVSYR